MNVSILGKVNHSIRAATWECSRSAGWKVLGGNDNDKTGENINARVLRQIYRQ